MAGVGLAWAYDFSFVPVRASKRGLFTTQRKTYIQTIFCSLGTSNQTIFSILYHSILKMSDKYKSSIEIPAVSAEILETILSFIYTTRLVISMDNVFELMEAANYLQVPRKMFSLSVLKLFFWHSSSFAKYEVVSNLWLEIYFWN